VAGVKLTRDVIVSIPELDTDWMHPWIGLDWIGFDWIGSNVGKNWMDWIGLRRMDDVILCYILSKQVCLDY